MVEKYDSIIKTGVWEVVPRPADKSVVSSRRLYKVKKATDESVEKHKARFVVRGFSQVEGIDYEEPFSPVTSDFTRLGFTKGEADANLYHIVVEDKMLITVLYVNDLILTCDEKLIKYCKDDIAREFKMKGIGLMHYFLGIEVWQGDDELFFSHGNYANDILNKFHMESSKPMDTCPVGNWREEDVTSSEVVEANIYRQLVVSLMYVVKTPPKMCFLFK
eukprot:PITA_07177